MGLLDGLKRRRAEKAHAAALEAHHNDLEEWKAVSDRLTSWIETVQACVDGKIDEQFVDRSDYGFMFDSDEFAVACISGTALLQVVKTPGSYRGGYGGVSFPVFGRVRGHVGSQRGTFVPGPEVQKVTDTGITMITNRRVMFRGDLRTDQWVFAKMMSMQHSEDGITTISMSSRGKPEAVGYGEEQAPEIQFRFEIGAALARDTLPRFLDELRAEQKHHEEGKPIAPPPL
ncbi:MAG: hypothetical protein ACKO1X_01625 [Acidimicrobiales bacterium]